MRPFSVLIAVLVLSHGTVFGQLKTRDELVREDLAEIVEGAFWIYNDLPRGIAIAERTGKPLLVVFRCIPCEACAQLDSDIVERDLRVRGLLEKFVCVRVVHANGMDLSLFQFDYDQSFAAFLMNADKTIYGRYGTRSHQTESEDDVSLEGFAAALEAALALHAEYPDNKAALAGKQPQDVPPFAVPEQFPGLRGRYDASLKYEGEVAKSCIHCHQVGEALRDIHHAAGRPIPETVLFPYPHPKALGLVMDPKETAVVSRVAPDSPAARDGFLAGDRIESLAGQPLLSIADIQWVLHNAPAKGEISALVIRNGRAVPLELTLDEGWRRRDNISWRATSWALRRMVTGGLLLNDAPEGARKEAGLAEDSLALVVRHVGQYGPHALAKQAGFQTGDVLISVDGRNTAMRETDLFAYLVNKKQIGDEFAVKVWRKGERVELRLRIQE
jgi:serine protease Do